MISFRLVKTPNQKFSTNINNHVFEFSFRTFRGVTYVTVAIDGTTMECSVKAIPNTSLFTSPTNKIAGGEFEFICSSDDYPHYEKFNGIDVIFAFIPFGG